MPSFYGSVGVTQSLKTSVVMVEECAVGVLLHRHREQALGWWCVPQSCEGGRSVSQRTDAGRMDAASLENI